MRARSHQQVEFLLLFFILAGAALVVRPHSIHLNRGKGAPSPKAALTLFAQALCDKNYPALREVIHYSRLQCGGMGCVALDAYSPQSVDLFLADHHDTLSRSMANPDSPLYHGQFSHERFATLWFQRLLPYRKAMLPYFDVWLEMEVVAAPEATRISIEYPRMVVNERWQVIGVSREETNNLSLIKKGGRWFVLNLSCHAASVSREPVREP